MKQAQTKNWTIYDVILGDTVAQGDTYIKAAIEAIQCCGLEDELEAALAQILERHDFAAHEGAD